MITKQDHELMRRKLWCDACITATRVKMMSYTGYADHMLEEFDKRFKLQDGPRCTNIIVNGEKKIFIGSKISYREVIKEAFPGASDTFIYTVIYSVKNGNSGTMAPVDPYNSVEVCEGMTFEVCDTSSA